MPESVRAVLYAAKSMEDKHGSIPDQPADCRWLAAERDVQVEGALELHARGDRTRRLRNDLQNLVRPDAGSCIAREGPESKLGGPA